MQTATHEEAAPIRGGAISSSSAGDPQGVLLRLQGRERRQRAV